jgi:hypothetical protein
MKLITKLSPQPYDPARSYTNISTCAYASWCQDTSQNPSLKTLTDPSPLCWKKEKIQQMGDWPLTRIGSIFTLFGSPYTIMASQANISSQQTIGIIYLAFDTTHYHSERKTPALQAWG